MEKLGDTAGRGEGTRVNPLTVMQVSMLVLTSAVDKRGHDIMFWVDCYHVPPVHEMDASCSSSFSMPRRQLSHARQRSPQAPLHPFHPSAQRPPIVDGSQHVAQTPSSLPRNGARLPSSTNAPRHPPSMPPCPSSRPPTACSCGWLVVCTAGLVCRPSCARGLHALPYTLRLHRIGPHPGDAP